jgi:hypothetical protein
MYTSRHEATTLKTQPSDDYAQKPDDDESKPLPSIRFKMAFCAHGATVVKVISDKLDFEVVIQGHLSIVKCPSQRGFVNSP